MRFGLATCSLCFDILRPVMAASVHTVARNLYYWAKGNPARMADIQTAFDSAVSGGALSKGGMDSVTSATKNGVTMQKMVGLHEGDRQTALRLALQYLEAGILPSSSRAFGRF